MTDDQEELKQAVVEAVAVLNAATHRASEAGLEVLADITEPEHAGRPIFGVTVLSRRTLQTTE